ncbi:hypothetical protein OKW43_001633 [Paraburkholderia sp. WC7.3g]|uniref:Secreted protein n=1 Tax=Paraburkholderia podalyriae TaxID=1938811 RepID=A0ABR7PVM4_9BURK|nr:hypothetical protein [Paraburkholderia podalyriae]MBC8750325.1 hypothetical protein [Paraburkholderia podalyriae]
MTKPMETSRCGRIFVSGMLRAALALASGVCMVSAHADAQMRAITIVSGTYGENCGAPRGNLTRELARHCNGRATCEYPLPGLHKGGTTLACPRDFHAEWHCDDADVHSAALGPGAKSGDTLVLGCTESRGAGK